MKISYLRDLHTKKDEIPSRESDLSRKRISVPLHIDAAPPSNSGILSRSDESFLADALRQIAGEK